MSDNIFGVEIASGVSVIEEGSYDAVLSAIIQNGVHNREYQGKPLKPAMMVKLIFEIPELTYGEGDEKQTQTLGKEMPALMSDRSNFFKFFKAMGIIKEPTNEELSRVFGTKEAVESLLGTAVSVNVEHFEKQDGSKGHYIASVSKLDPRLPQPEAKRKPYIFTFSDPDIDVFKNDLSPYGRKRIMDSLNVKDLPKEFHEAYIAEQEANNSKKGEIL